MKLKPAEEQVVALMGTSSGIGREAALRFAGSGARDRGSLADEVVSRRRGKRLRT